MLVIFRVILSGLLIEILAGCSERLPLKKEIVGKYQSDTKHVTMEFFEDNSFSLQSMAASGEWCETTGTYDLEYAGEPAVVTRGVVVTNQISDHQNWQFKQGSGYVPFYTKERHNTIDLEIFNEPSPFVFRKLDTSSN